MSTSTLDLVVNLADNASAPLQNIGSSVSNLNPAFLAAGAAAGAATTAIVGIGSAALSIAGDAQAAVRSFEVQLGVTGERATELGEVAKDVFANNFGESIQDAASKVAEIDRQMGEFISSNEELSSVTQGVQSIADAFDSDFNTVATAATALMDQLGLSSTEALDFIAKGFQDGLNNSDDFLETIGEYSIQFGEAGYEANEFYSILQTGAQAGLLGTD
ncbi:hypothetical protein HC928_07995, partial [bacterium]|nr:hypothetical protein [bacterium]